MAAKSLEDLTVDELRATAASLQSQASLFGLLVGDPRTRETVQRAIKTLKPELVIPEIDATDKVTKKIDELAEDNKKLRLEILQERVGQRLERERAAAATEFRLTEEDMKGVEALMVNKDKPEESIPSYRLAAQLYKAQRISAVPTPSTFVPPVFEMPEKGTWGKGIGNKAMLDKIALNEAWAALGELQGGKVPGLGAARA